MNTFKQQLPTYANDLKLNFSSAIENADDSELSKQQIASIALACSYACKQKHLIAAIKQFADEMLDEQGITAAKAAASIMAMNNVYYRATHLMQDRSYSTMPAKLRMNIIGNPGVDKIDFELMSLAVSVINGCSKCIDSHTATLTKSGLDKSTIQHTLRISAIINGLAQVAELEYEQTENINA